jgi:CelD/BcsL family acetyltransferase involved in cellulose biosynthesis
MQFDVALEPLPTTDTLASRWRELEARANLTFYTSWSWIGNWLAVLPSSTKPHLLVARTAGVIVGMAVVVQGHTRLFKWLPVRSWHVHATGKQALDQLTIEYNGFVTTREHSLAIKRAMLHHLLHKTPVRKVNVTLADDDIQSLAKHAHNGTLVRSTESPSYVVDLNRVRAKTEGYLQLLSANTRGQIRRSQTEYTRFGALTVKSADTLEEARTYIAALRDLHQRRWSGKAGASAFVQSPISRRFHDDLIANAFDRGEIQLLRVRAGEHDVGYLYNFVCRGRVVFYQSGFNYGLLDKHDRPGLVCHKLAIEHNACAGHTVYDFAAGDYRYKSSLSTHCEPQASHVFQQDGLLPRLDMCLRQLQTGLSQRSAQLRRWRSRLYELGLSAAVALSDLGFDAEPAELLLGLPVA